MIQPLIEFIKLTHQFQALERVVRLPGREAQENDAEHSYQLALTAWYLIESRGYVFNLDKVLRYALVHDLVEIYAGDTYIYASPEELAGKAQREKDAAKRLKRELPDFPSLHKLIHAYEAKADKESRFVYALDKILPVINIYLGEGRSWQERSTRLQQIIENKTPKVALSPELVPYWDELLDVLRAEEDVLFGSPLPLP